MASPVSTVLRYQSYMTSIKNFEYFYKLALLNIIGQTGDMIYGCVLQI
jgi:hypothetical protein